MAQKQWQSDWLADLLNITIATNARVQRGIANPINSRFKYHATVFSIAVTFLIADYFVRGMKIGRMYYRSTNLLLIMRT